MTLYQKKLQNQLPPQWRMEATQARNAEADPRPDPQTTIPESVAKDNHQTLPNPAKTKIPITPYEIFPQAGPNFTIFENDPWNPYSQPTPLPEHLSSPSNHAEFSSLSPPKAPHRSRKMDHSAYAMTNPRYGRSKPKAKYQRRRTGKRGGSGLDLVGVSKAVAVVALATAVVVTMRRVWK